MKLEKQYDNRRTQNQEKDLDDVKAFIEKTKIQNETLKKIITSLNKDKNHKKLD